MSFETSFDSKQPKLEVSALSETKRLFRLFRFYTETESFDDSIEPKQTEDQPKQNRIFYFPHTTTVIYNATKSTKIYMRIAVNMGG